MKIRRLALRDMPWSDSLRVVQAWADAVQAVLSGSMRFGDQLGAVVTATWNSDRQSPIAVGTTTRPQTVLLLSATADGATASISGAPITWTWSGASSSTITITAATGLAASTDYAMVLLVVEGG